jgi:transcriptional regulator with XRE-family HTH domain
MKYMSLKEKLNALKGENPSGWRDKALYRKNNREWLQRSQAIAVRILEALRNQSLSQKALAEKLQVTPQQISKILKGEENLTLQTITQIETALGIKLIYLISITHTQIFELPALQKKGALLKTVQKKTDKLSLDDEAEISESILMDSN